MNWKCDGNVSIQDCLRCPFPDCVAPENMANVASRRKKRADVLKVKQDARQQYRERKAAGLCTRCGTEKAAAGMLVCRKCFEEVRKK